MALSQSHLTTKPQQGGAVRDLGRDLGAKPVPRLRLKRLLVTVTVAAVMGTLLTLPSSFPDSVVIGRAVITGLIAMSAFSLAERLPSRLPKWLPRWVWQLSAIGVTTVPAAFFAYALTTGGDPQWHDPDRFQSAAVLGFLGLLIGPWVALAGLLVEREAFAREQGLALELARSELARMEVDARWRLLQAQTTPHFLFNTLANVQALVDLRSPRASELLGSLIAYLRAAVPHAAESSSSIAQEVDMSRAYLEIMRTRIPDRLRYRLDVHPATLPLRCPSMALLTLIENAVRHGVDPSEEGGEIEAEVRVRDGRCRIVVRNPCPTPAALQRSALPPAGLGTGLNALRERLHLLYGGQARLEAGPDGVNRYVAQLEFPLG